MATRPALEKLKAILSKQTKEDWDRCAAEKEDELNESSAKNVLGISDKGFSLKFAFKEASRKK